MEDPHTRLERALHELYGWYRETEPMTAKVLRDAELLPALRAVIESGLGAYLEHVRGTLTEPFRARGRRRERIDAAVRAAVDLHLWHALAPLGDAEAAELAAALVDRATTRSEPAIASHSPRRGRPVARRPRDETRSSS